MVYLVIAVVSGALIVGALWGMYGPLNKSAEGFMVALAGGALIVAVMIEMIEPAIEKTSLLNATIFIFIGAICFTALDYLIDEKWGANKGGGLLAAITMDGVPENLALGVGLISASVTDVSALAAAILLSNLPEAMGGASEMKKSDLSDLQVISLWVGCAILLSSAALIGHYFFTDAEPDTLAHISCFAAGAVVASLATEVFPKAFKENHHWAGIAVAVGLTSAYALAKIGGN